MIIPANYIHAPEISELLQRIAAAKSVIDTITVLPEIETNFRRQTILKSSLYSARIEGNPLTLTEVTGKPSKDQKKQEVFNILKGMQFMHARGARDISISYLMQLHMKTMKGLIDAENFGKVRREVSAIFNTAGIAIYMPPMPRQVTPLLTRLLKFVNSDKEQFVPIRAALSHYSFEKIHPFLDGNGRVGRLLFQSVLQKSGFGMKGLLAIEEFLDNNRSEYYDVLAVGERDITDYIEFMLEALAESAEKAQKLVTTKHEAKPEEYLLPRRAEILQIIHEQHLVNFNQIHRRFLQINDRTLRYDLKQLQDDGFIRKRGTTKGVYYEAITSKTER